MLPLVLFVAAAAPALADLGSLPLANSTVVVFNSSVSVPGARTRVACYRIPGVVQTAKAIVAFAEAREVAPGSLAPSCGDCVVNGIAMRRSLDGGRSWGPYRWAVSDHSTDPSRPHFDVGGNPSAVYDAASGRLILQFVRGLLNDPTGQSCNPATSNWQIESSDDGETWSKPVEISGFLGRYKGSLVGPANGIQLQRAVQHKGRLVWCGHWGVYNSTQVWFSDDGGATYTLSRSVFARMDECTVAELEDGSVMINMRNNHLTSCHCRAVAVSTDGGASFGAVSFDPTLISPVCQGTLSSAGGHLLFANPANAGEGFNDARTQGTIRKSLDLGQTWPRQLAVTPHGKSARDGGSFDYSCLVPDELRGADGAKTGEGGLLWSHRAGGERCNANPAPVGCWLVLFSRFDLNF